jgi:trigger factor
MPTVEQISREQNIVRVRVAFDTAEVNKEFQRVYRELANSLRLPGFRKGKIPPNIIRQRVGVEDIADAVEDYLREKAADAAVDELKLFPRKGQSTWHEEPKPVEGEALAYEFSFPVMPEAKLPDYKSFEFSLPRLEVTEGMKERFYERMRERMTEFPEITTPAAEGNGALVKLTSTFAEGGEAAPFGQDVMLYVIGKEGNLPGWDEQVLGAVPEQVIEFPYTIPEDFSDPRVAGKALLVKLEVKSVHEVIAPVIDDAYIKEHFGMESLAEYDNYVIQHLTYERDAMAHQMRRDMVVQKLVEGIEADISTDMIEEAVDAMVKENDRELKEKESSLQDQLQQSGKTMEEHRESVRPLAENRIKLTLAVRTLASQENLRPTVQDFERYAAYMAQREGITPKQFKELLNYPEFVSETTHQIMQEKVLDYLVGCAKFTTAVAADTPAATADAPPPAAADAEADPDAPES